LVFSINNIKASQLQINQKAKELLFSEKKAAFFP
jgi:hypothetical protein